MARSRLLRRLFGVGAVCVALSAIVACNALLGLDEFEKAECSGRVCGDASTFDVAAVDTGVDAAVDAPRGADPVSWAKWPMPNYDGGAVFLPNQPSYQTVGASVEDQVTRLVWRAEFVPGDFKFAAAQTACSNLPDGPWRLPKRIELLSLVDYAKPGTKIDATKFPGVTTSTAWTSSEVRPFVGGDAQQYWTVNFESGLVSAKPGNAFDAKVLCVKAK